MWKFADGPLNRQDRYLRRLRLDHLRISYNEHLCRFNVSRSEGSTIFAFSLSSELLGALHPLHEAVALYSSKILSQCGSYSPLFS